MSDIQRYIHRPKGMDPDGCGKWCVHAEAMNHYHKIIEDKEKEIRGLSNLLIGLGECDGDAKELMYRQQTHIVMLKKQNDFLTKFLEVSDMVEAAQNWIALNSGGGSND